MKGIFNLFSFQINKTLNEVNSEELREPHLVQLFNRFATYNGSSPFKTPGMMTLIQHLEQEYGTYVSKKGMINIVNSLYKLGLRQNIEFKFNHLVSEIILENKKAVGVRVNDQIFKSDVVISNMDIVPTYKRLLKTSFHPEKILQQERSSSALIFYWGINKNFKNLELHNILFSKNYKEEFESIFKYLSNALSEGRNIEIRGLGTFKVKKMPARNARNPKTGETIQIEEKNKVKWKSSKLLNYRINKDKKIEE